VKRLIYVNEYANHKPSSGHKRTWVRILIMLNLELLLAARNTELCQLYMCNRGL